MSQSIALLTYHGDEVITTPFSTPNNAIDYALDELVDCTDYPREAFEVLTDRDQINQYTTDENVIGVISDSPEGGDERIYTITRVQLDPTYQSKFK